MITPKTYDFPQIEQKDKIKRRVIKIVAASAACIFAVFCAWKAGFFHKTILKKWYSPVQIEMEMPHSLSGQMDLPVKAFFFENDNENIPEISGSERTLFVKGTRFWEKLVSFDFSKKVVAERPASKNKIYSMKTLFLKHGKYRVKVVVGPYVWWKSFEVADKDCLISCDFLKNMTRELKIKTYAYDAQSGNDISENCNFMILYKNNWTNLEEVEAKLIKSGTVWRIKASCEGYKEEVFSLLIDWYQDDLIISAMLEKTTENLAD